MFKYAYLLVFPTLLFFSCNKDDDQSDGGGNSEIYIEQLIGKSQKGPFNNGAQILLFELASDFTSTGNSFSEEIDNNRGEFVLEDLTLLSPYIQIRADGFYFNEVLGSNSNAQLSLSALVDATNASTVNVNVLTALQKRRLEYLIEGGSTFEEANAQSRQEILSIFEVVKTDMPGYETLDISKNGDEHAILLAISVILQGYDNVATLSSLIADISSDMESDGTLDDDELCDQLVKNALKLKLSEIRTNLTEHFDNLNISDAVVPDFEKYVNQFIDNTDCVPSTSITYPESGGTGLNILHPNFLSHPTGVYSMTADLETGTSLKVKVSGNNWIFVGQPSLGWTASNLNFLDYSRTFTANKTGVVDMEIRLVRQPFPDGPLSNEVNIEIFENGSIEPTIEKTITLSDFQSQITYPLDGNFPGGNILAYNVAPYALTSGEPSSTAMVAMVPEGMSVKVNLSGPPWSIWQPEQNTGWSYGPLDQETNTRTFTTTQSGWVEIRILLTPDPCNMPTNLEVEIFENNASSATDSFFMTVEPGEFFGNDPHFSSSGIYGINILDRIGSGVPLQPGTYSMEAMQVGFLKIVLYGEGWALPTPIVSEGWVIHDYNDQTSSQTFEAYRESRCDLKIELAAVDNAPTDITVEVYLDCQNPDVPSETKSITIEP